MFEITLPDLAPQAAGRRVGPLGRQLIEHAMRALPQHRRRAFEQALWSMRRGDFTELESAIGHTLSASGRSMGQCLSDLDTFNALSADIDNDAWYDRPQAFTSMHLDALLPGFARRRHLCTLRQVAAHASAAIDVLEVGSGSGRLSTLMADSDPRWRFTLVDRSEAAVEFARALHSARGTLARVCSLRGDLADLPVPDESADLVVAAEVLEHAPDPDASTRDLLRVLRPGGWLAISLPIDLNIAMHPTVFASEAEILAFFASHSLVICESSIVAPDPALDAIADVFPYFGGCVNAVFRKPG